MYEEIKTACLYVRYSSANQTEQSIEGQIRVCRDFCNRHNIRVVEVYADRATSASKDIEKRVQFLKMIKDSEKHTFDAVIVYKLDRFSRSRYDSANYKYKLKKNGVQLISATENISNDPEGIILESVLEGMAEFYSAELSQKINRGLRESAYKHNSLGGQIPLGYKSEGKKLVIDEDTAHIVREAFEMYAEGESVAEICRTFNAKGYKTSKGTRFGKSSFSKIFRNERYLGVYQFHDYRAEDAIPAIIDRKLFDQVQARMKTVAKAPARNKAKRAYLLAGKLFCGHCGCKMNGSMNTNGYSYYECYGKKNLHKDCHKKNLRREFIEDVVVRDAMSLLTDENIETIADVAIRANAQEMENTTNIPSLRGRLHETRVSLDNLTKAIESGLAPETLVKRMVELEKEKKILETELRNEEKDVVYLEKAQVIYWLEQFKDGDIEDEDFCRLLVDLFVNSVTVWDDEDDYFTITLAYNLTSLQNKTYRLSKGGTPLSDFTLNAPFWTVDTLFYAVSKESFDLDFAFDIFQNIDWKKKDESTGVPSLSKTTINDVVVSATCYKEQQRLGRFFKSLDQLIALRQRRYDKLTKVKACMLEKMFPKEGADVPEIRFKGFTKPWESVCLKDFASEVNRTDRMSNAPVMMITAANGFIQQSDRYSFDNAGQSLARYILLKKGELAYNHGASKLRPYGSCFALKAEEARIPYVYHCFCVDSHNPYFVSRVLNGRETEKQLRRLVTSGARMDGLLNISYEEYASVRLMLPKREEQDRIAEYFAHIEELIALCRHELDKLQALKRALLKKMFV